MKTPSQTTNVEVRGWSWNDEGRIRGLLEINRCHHLITPLGCHQLLEEYEYKCHNTTQEQVSACRHSSPAACTDSTREV